MEKFDHTSGQYHPIGEAKIYYESKGNKNGPVLILLHGGFGSMEDFNSILPSLTGQFHVIGIDSRGQGKSTLGKEKLTYERIQLDIESLLQVLKINTISIVGFSDGGIVAYRLATYSALNIEKVITIGSRWNISDALLTKEIFLKITAESWKEKFPETYTTYERLNPEPDFNHLTTELINMWLDPGTTGYPNDDITNINAPVLIVRGDTDHLLSRKSACELAERIEKSKLLNIPFAGHVAFLSQQEIFTIVLDRFLKDKS